MLSQRLNVCWIFLRNWTTHSKSHKWSKSRKRSKSRRRSKSRAHSNHEVRKPGVWPSQWGWSPSKGHPEEDRSCRLLSTSSHSYEQTRSSGCAAHLVPSKEELSKFLKLKEEVVKQPQGYIQGHAKLITCTLTPNHKAVKCLMAFGKNTLKYAVEMLATIEWGTQHWKLQESFPVPPVPRWLQMPDLMQTTTPLRGELPLIPSVAHLEDIHIRSPALWVWMAILLQYWQDHMTGHLYGGCFWQASKLASTLICDINPWLPHRACFRWSYVATHATLWLDMRDQFAKEHHTEWEAQKSLMHSLNNLEHDTKVIYWACLIKRQEDKEVANSREAAVKQLPPEWQAVHVERQAWAMPTNPDAAPVRSQATLYPTWVWTWVTKPQGSDPPRPYRTPRQDADRDFLLEEELGTNSVFDPLALGSQSSQPSGSQPSSSPDTTMSAAGPKIPPHFSEASPTIPPFDLALLGLPAPMSPMTVGENALLNMAPGSPVKSSAPPGIGHGARGSGLSSCSDSPMSMGSPAITSSLTLALKARTRAPTPASLDARKESSEESSNEEDMDAADNSPRDGTDWSSTTHLKTTVSTQPACLIWCTARVWPPTWRQ